MDIIFQHVTHWTWFILAVTLIAIEIFLPSTIFVWFGVAAAIVGIALMILPGLSWEVQLLTFAAISILSISSWRIYLRVHPPQSDNPLLNRRSEQYIGGTFLLETAIVNGTGKVRVGDTLWTVKGPDLQSGSKVRVTGVDGPILMVETVEE